MSRSTLPIRACYLGRKDYTSTLALQQLIFDKKVADARSKRGVGVTQNSTEGTVARPTPNTVLAVEHSPNVITIGKRDTTAGIFTEKSAGEGVVSNTQIVKTRRGGGLTWHGQGQVTVYPILDVQTLWKSSLDPQKGKSPLMWYTAALEETMILTSKEFSVEAERGAVGVWVRQKDVVGDSRPQATNSSETQSSSSSSFYADATTEANNTMKIGSVGLQVSNWVSMHGIGYNVCCDTTEFDKFVMCELPGKRATSLHREILQEQQRRGDSLSAGLQAGTAMRRRMPTMPEVAGALIRNLMIALKQPEGAIELDWCSDLSSPEK